MSKPKKEQKILEKVEEEDYRGIMSLILNGGYVAGVIVAAIIKPDAVDIISGVLGPLAGAAGGWYFREWVGR